MILRLEHVEHVRSKRLRRLHDERAGRIALVASLERGGRAMDRHSRLEQRIDELRRGQEVGLIGWQDVAACVAMGRVAELALEVAASATQRPARRGETVQESRFPRSMAFFPIR